MIWRLSGGTGDGSTFVCRLRFALLRVELKKIFIAQAGNRFLQAIGGQAVGRSPDGVVEPFLDPTMVGFTASQKLTQSAKIAQIGLGQCGGDLLECILVGCELTFRAWWPR